MQCDGRTLVCESRGVGFNSLHFPQCGFSSSGKARVFQTRLEGSDSPNPLYAGSLGLCAGTVRARSAYSFHTGYLSMKSSILFLDSSQSAGRSTRGVPTRNGFTIGAFTSSFSQGRKDGPPPAPQVLQTQKNFGPWTETSSIFQSCCFISCPSGSMV